MKIVNVTSPIALSATQLKNLKTALKLNETDKINQIVDTSVVAGLLVEVDGVAVDLTVKHQLHQIARG